MARKLLVSLAAVVLGCVSVSPAAAQSDANRWAPVDAALGRSGTTQPDGVRRYAFPRSDLKVTLDGVAVKPALALGSWLAFMPVGDQAMVMGDLVLTHEEVNPVMSQLLAGGLTVTALHNHLLRSAPATMYMHVEGHGDPAKLAITLWSALGRSRTPMSAPAKAPDAKLDLDTAALDKTMGASGKVNGGVYQFSFPRAEKLADGNMPAPASMGTATAINFQPTGDGKAAVTGDLVLTAREVDPVLRALRTGGIEVTALHNHMLDDSPRLFFMHFWANDEAQRLARSLRAALDSTAVKRTAAATAVNGAKKAER